MKQEIREWARKCIPCQKCKVHRHTKSKFGEYEVPDTRFSVIHIDLIGPLPPSQGMTFSMTCINRFSCWMEAVPLPDCKAQTASKAFYEHWVCRFGVPGKIITDQGRQFESQLFRSLAAICGAKVAHATSYHPQCNGKVERLHRTLKGAIKAHNNIKWTETLPTILLGLRTALRPDTNHTIAQMVYGSNIRLPGEFFNPPSIQIDPETFVTTLQTFMDALKPTESSPPKIKRIFVHKDLKSCTHVFVRVDRVRKALEPPYDGPFPVKERYEKYFTLTIKNKPVNISVDRLKPAYLLMTDSIPDKTTVLCKQSDENSAANDTNLLTDVKPTVSRHGRLVKKPITRLATVGIFGLDLLQCFGASSAKPNGINVLFEFFEATFYFLNVIEPNVHNSSKIRPTSRTKYRFPIVDRDSDHSRISPVRNPPYFADSLSFFLLAEGTSQRLPQNPIFSFGLSCSPYIYISHHLSPNHPSVFSCSSPAPVGLSSLDL
ncbi:retrovirus-related Pol polyprotein from transposon 412 [Trichonephila clavipes]|nr:retrovirus-related Pol polyprotein from transposon 412 [Trichonephila clavipes]